MLDEAWHPVTAPASYCMADIFHACRAFLCSESEYICSNVKGFLKTPYAITSPITVTKNEMILSAKELRADGWLPEAIKVGKNLLGPADWLRAALCVLCGEDVVTVKPEQWQIDMDQFAKLRDLDLKLKWIDTKHLMDNYLSQRSRLQSWTIRLPEGYPRKIAL
ncbi:MAG: hypothetical protein E7312_08660 [Clostridiales bacterium]|nr:hypothetical protein [Clostridiales bacterium]